MKNHHTVTCKTVWSQQVKLFIKDMIKKKKDILKTIQILLVASGLRLHHH